MPLANWFGALAVTTSRSPSMPKTSMCPHTGAAGVGSSGDGGNASLGLNLRYPRPKTMESDYPISAIRTIRRWVRSGPAVVPGNTTSADCPWCGANAKAEGP